MTWLSDPDMGMIGRHTFTLFPTDEGVELVLEAETVTRLSPGLAQAFAGERYAVNVSEGFVVAVRAELGVLAAIDDVRVAVAAYRAESSDERRHEVALAGLALIEARKRLAGVAVPGGLDEVIDVLRDVMGVAR